MACGLSGRCTTDSMEHLGVAEEVAARKLGRVFRCRRYLAIQRKALTFHVLAREMSADRGSFLVTHNEIVRAKICRRDLPQDVKKIDMIP
ncbi:hypothetical protein RGCCGE502_30862 (plasmid) [Rhizobium grahamii CCGE 502]|uniref:Uncharacterized protein n=1 Tax=Rhizobium grahamii CCGE 502 TaxID=990285 RepID=S3H7H8_9HYPH|nr:hypothetical protein RGCCGE502_30862 [Rhizobium grahamii CCGE 502]